jgi:transglutaminase-like putative cysteine protease
LNALVRAQIRHITEYTYPQPAQDSFNELRLEPAQTATQSLLGFQLILEPDVPVTSHTDYFGLEVHSFQVRQPHTRLRIETHAVVVTHPLPVPQPVPVRDLEPYRAAMYEFIAPSARVPAGGWLERLGLRAPSDRDDLLEHLHTLNAHLHKQFQYAPGATRIGTSLDEFIHLERGVCQDYAHLLIALCREARIPARYVSGYVYAGRDFVGAGATHAWVEAFVPGTGWVGFDPLNGVMQSEYHVIIGAGRDYNDVAPVRGSRRGGGEERLEVKVNVRAQEQ